MQMLRTPIRMSLYALTGAVLVAGLGLARSASAQTVERKVATLAPRGSAWLTLLEKSGAELEKATEGRVKTKYYPNGVQGDEREVIRKMRLGQLDGASVTSVGLSLIEPGIRLLEVPRIFDSIEERNYVRGKMWPYYREAFAKSGFMLLEPEDAGVVHVYSRGPIDSVDALRAAMARRSPGNPIASEMMRQLGVEQQADDGRMGPIDATWTTARAAADPQSEGGLGYMASMPLAYKIAAQVMRKESWDRLSPRDREAVQNMARRDAQARQRTVPQEDEAARAQQVRQGLRIVETPPAMIREVDAAAEKAARALVGKAYAQAELDMLLKYRAEYRARSRRAAPSR